jgi:hypothetical protein
MIELSTFQLFASVRYKQKQVESLLKIWHAGLELCRCSELASKSPKWYYHIISTRLRWHNEKRLYHQWLVYHLHWQSKYSVVGLLRHVNYVWRLDGNVKWYFFHSTYSINNIQYSMWCNILFTYIRWLKVEVSYYSSYVITQKIFGRFKLNYCAFIIVGE